MGDRLTRKQIEVGIMIRVTILLFFIIVFGALAWAPAV